jgi:hypothetical protein
MAKLTRQLHKLAKGGNEEWWRLVLDTKAQRLYIEHEWSHTDAWRASRSKSGTAEFDINGFLAEGEASAQAALQRIIEKLFENGGGESA